MSYQVIARKYRPQRFEDVVGQEHVTQTLAQAIKQNRIAHAYLFCGPRGTGKTTVARIFAKCLNCTDGPKVDFDDKDPRCIEITEGRSLDVMEIDGASNNGVEQVRQLRETCQYAPANSKFKVYIIDEVHMLSSGAFNALLKTLEEPPAHVKFMFATTDPEKILPTILSRCQRFDLRRISQTLIAKHLAEIARKEKVKVNQPALDAIARGADGGMRDAESTLDQLISFCGNEIEEADVLSMFGLVAHSQILGLVKAVLDGEIEPALRQLNGLATGGKDLGRLVSDLLGHFRNLLIYQVSKGDLGMLEVSESEAEDLKQQSGLISTEGLTRILEVFAEAEMRLRDATSKKILIEVSLMRAIEARNAISVDALLKQLKGMQAGGGGSLQLPSAKAPTPARAATPKVKAEAPTTPDIISSRVDEKPPVQAGTTAPVVAKPASAPAMAGPSADLAAIWVLLVETVSRASPFIKTYMAEAHPVSFVKNVFTIGFPPEAEDHMGLVDNPRNNALLKEKLAEQGYHEVHFKFVKAATPEGFRLPPVATTPAAIPLPPANSMPAPPQPGPVATAKAAPALSPTIAPAAVSTAGRTQSVPFNKDDFKNDPLIQKALEMFKGQIVEVRAQV